LQQQGTTFSIGSKGMAFEKSIDGRIVVDYHFAVETTSGDTGRRVTVNS
jgi:hypothetical protein